MSYQVTFATPWTSKIGETVYVNFADGTQWELAPGADALEELIAQTDWQDIARRLAIARARVKDPLGDSPQDVNGKTVTLNLEYPTPSGVVTGF